MKELPQTFIEFVKLIGTPFFIGVMVSLVINYWAWFNKKSSAVKRIIVFFICVGFPIVSQLLLLYLPAAAIAFLEFWWPVLMIGVGSFIASQGWHAATKNKLNQVPVAQLTTGKKVTPDLVKEVTPDLVHRTNMPG